MKLSQIFLTNTFLILSSLCFGQTGITKEKVLRTFQKSIRQASKEKVSIGSNPWVVCNDDSAFFKSEVINLYNSISYPYTTKYCNFINWEFYKNDAFVQTTNQICKEPPSESTPNSKSWFIVKVVEKNKSVILETLNQGEVISKYVVLGINEVPVGKKNEKVTCIKLKRV